jgi:hypothetical protein
MVPAASCEAGQPKWPVFVMNRAFRVTEDKNLEPCSVLDVVVHPSVIVSCLEDYSWRCRDEVWILLYTVCPLLHKDRETCCAACVFSAPFVSFCLCVSVCVPLYVS